MSGIAGIIDWLGPPEATAEVTRRMTMALGHQEKAPARIWSGDHAGLGQRLHERGAIRIAGGPFVAKHAAGSVVAVCDGQIDNRSTARLRLVAHGHRFHGGTDAELVLRAYEQWGQRCAEQIDGIFAFAVWDARRRKLLLARDRFGFKPLFYALRPGRIVFGSQIKSLLAAGTPAEVDADGLAELMSLTPVTCPGSTVFHGIGELPPACVLSYRHDGHATRRYWGLEAAPHIDSVEDTVATVGSLLADGVRQQLPAGQPAVILACGDLPGYTVAAVAAEWLRGSGHDLLTFALAEDTTADSTTPNGTTDQTTDGLADDLADDLAVAEHIKSIHRQVPLTADTLLDAQACALSALDIPSPPTLTLPLGALLPAVAPYAPAVLTGVGGRELFFGHRWLHDHHDYGRPGWPWQHLYPPVTGLFNRAARQHAKPRWLSIQRYHAALAQVPILPGETRTQRRLRQVAALALTHHLPFVLRRLDGLGRRHGVQTGAPLLSQALVDYAWNIPAHMKTAGRSVMSLLHRAVAGLLPTGIAHLDNNGEPALVMPPGFAQAVRQQTHELLAARSSPLLPLLDAAAVAELLDRPNEPGGHSVPHLAYLLEIDMWLRQYKLRIR